jgi:hypothetical protein
MEGRKPPPPVTVQRAFVPTRLSDELLAQAYEQVLHSARQVATSPATTSPATPAARPNLSRERVPRVATTGGRT